MKIGFFTDSYVPGRSGFDNSIETFKQDFEKLGHKVYVFAPLYKNCKDKEHNVLRFNSLKILENPETRLAFPFFPTNRNLKIEEIKLDIVHAHDPFLMGMLGKYVAVQKNIPFFYTHHADYPEYTRVYFKEKFVLPFFANLLTIWFSNLSDAVIAPSYKTKNFLEKNGVKKEIHVVPTGIDINLFKKSLKERDAIRKKLKISDKAFVLIFIGRMSEEKNITFLLEVFRKALEKSKFPLNFIMVGDGQDFKKIKQISKKIKNFPFIRFVGAVSYKDVPKYYQAADVFVFSSLTETQGIVILEAMASELPVVALKDDVYNGIITNKKNGFLITQDPSTRSGQDPSTRSGQDPSVRSGQDKEKTENLFVRRIFELMNNRSLYKRISSANRQTACDFSRKKQAEKLLAIYNKIIEKERENKK
jgi:1,2-diacylglycerol 3-alpha-glucosyltransferase